MCGRVRWPIAISERKAQSSRAIKPTALPRFNRVESTHGKNLAMPPGCLVRLWFRPLIWGHPGDLIQGCRKQLHKRTRERVAAQRVGGMDPRSRAGRSHLFAGYESVQQLYVTVHANLCRSGPQMPPWTGTRRGVACLQSLDSLNSPPGLSMSDPIPTVSDRQTGAHQSRQNKPQQTGHVLEHPR